MSAIIDGTNGVTAATLVPSGSSAPTNGIYLPTTNAVAIATNSTNALYIDGSQNVGIGTSSPIGKLNVSAADNSIISLINGTTLGIRFGTSASFSNIEGVDKTGTVSYQPLMIGGSYTFFTTSGTERMRIDTSGNLLVGTTSATNSPSQGMTLMQNTNIGSIGIGHANGTGNGNTYMNFCYNGTQIGTIFQATTSSVAYQTTSDYRLKENVQKLNNGLSTVLSLNPVSYTWKRGGETDEGFIAHELQQYIPNAVFGEKDDVNKDGSIKPQGVDYSKIVVHLVAALQELKAEFDAYKASHP